MTPSQVGAFLDVPRTSSLATVDGRGHPHQAAMWFLHGDGELLMWTYGSAQKAVNLRGNPAASLLVEEGSEYDSLRGVMVRGQVTLIEDFARVREIGLGLYARYRIRTSAAESAGEFVDRQLRKRVGISLPMTRVVSWDHSRL